MIRYFLIFYLISFTAFSQRENIRFHHYGFEDGLESSSVNTIAEDSFGFIWVGTDDGLYRFDGYTFDLYKNSHDNNIGLVSNGITAILPMGNGDLWIGTREGLHKFDSRLELFVKIRLDSADSYISKIVNDPDGNLWIGSRNGLYSLDTSTGLVKKFIHKQIKPDLLRNIYDLHYDQKGRLWISTGGNGILILDPSGKNVNQLLHDPLDSTSISGNTMRKMARTSNGRMLVGTRESGLNIIDPQTLKATHFNHEENNPESLSAYSVFSILSDKDENIWIGTWSNGLNLFDPESGKAGRYIHNPDDRNSIPNNAVISLFQSSTGDIWLGTDHGGLARFNMNEQRIVRYQRDSRKKNTLLTSYIRSVYEDTDGILWLGTAQNGLHRYDRSTDEFQVYLESDGSRDALARGTIWSISPGENDILWLGTSRGVGKFNYKTGAIFFYEPRKNDSSSISTNNILKVHDDRRGHLWIGTWYGGLDKMDIATGKFTHFVADESDPRSLSSNNIKEIFTDSKGRLWVADTEHLNMMNPDGKTFTRYDLDVFGIDEDNNGNLWLATDDGVIRFTPEYGECTLAIREQEGLVSDQVNSVRIDNDGYIWAGTAKGVDRIDPETLKIFHLSTSGGLAGNHQDARSCFFNEQTNTLYFGGRKGLSEIHPEDFTVKDMPPRVVLTDFLIFNKSVEISDTTKLSQSLHTINKIRLNYSDKLVALEFAGLNFHEPEKLHYAYKLEGFDEKWVYTNASDRKAVYTNLPHGSYTFKVKASNTSGKFDDEQVTSLSVLVIPPWWRTWWAHALLYSGIMVLGYLLFNYRLSIIQKQNKRLEEQVRLRTAEVSLQRDELERQATQLQKINKQKNKLFSIIGHDLRSPLNSLQGIMPLLDPEMLSSSDLNQIKLDIAERIGNVRKVIENLLVWAKGQMEGEITDHQHVRLDELVNEKVGLFLPEAHKKNICINNHTNTDAEIFADENQVRTIIHNLISNAVKFTPTNGEIEINTEESRNEIILSIRDNGVGMHSEQVSRLFDIKTNTSTHGTAGERGVGLGMLLIKDFVEKNKGSIQVESKPGKGTAFHVTFRTSAELLESA